jgi:hypothetical protein
MEHEKIRMRQKQLRWADYNMDEKETSKAAMKNYKLNGEGSLPKPVSPQNLLYGRHIESEIGIDVITILERVCGKRGTYNLLITDYKSVCFSKSFVSRLQEVLLFFLKSCRSKSQFKASTYKC